MYGRKSQSERLIKTTVFTMRIFRPGNYLQNQSHEFGVRRNSRLNLQAHVHLWTSVLKRSLRSRITNCKEHTDCNPCASLHPVRIIMPVWKKHPDRHEHAVK